MNETLSWFTRTMHANETLVIPTVSGGINRLQAIVTLCNRERERERINGTREWTAKFQTCNRFNAKFHRNSMQRDQRISCERKSFFKSAACRIFETYARRLISFATKWNYLPFRELDWSCTREFRGITRCICNVWGERWFFFYCSRKRDIFLRQLIIQHGFNGR